MLRYIGWRLLWMIPTYLFLTLVAFLLLQSAPGDPVMYRMGKGNAQSDRSAQYQSGHSEYLRLRQEMGLNLPLFYFSVRPLSVPDTLNRIFSAPERSAYERLCFENGNTERIEQYRTHILQQIHSLQKTSDGVQKIALISAFRELLESATDASVHRTYEHIIGKLNAEEDPFIRTMGLKKVHTLMLEWDQLRQNQQKYRAFLPVITWNGIENRYHKWLAGMLRWDFGFSYQDNKPIGSKISEVIGWTLLINILSLLVIIFISIPLGLRLAKKNNTHVESVLMMFSAMPAFWVATLMLIYLCGGDYLSLFPSGGVQDLANDDTWSWSKKMTDHVWHLILPVLALSLGNLAYLTRQLNINIALELRSDYIRTVKSKGLSFDRAVNVHAFRNAILPAVHWLGGSIPAMVGGSIIIESVFSLPGMGTLMYDAIQFRDYPTVIAVFNLIAVFTLAGQLIADILYAYLDPRIRFQSGK